MDQCYYIGGQIQNVVRLHCQPPYLNLSAIKWSPISPREIPFLLSYCFLIEDSSGERIAWNCIVELRLLQAKRNESPESKSADVYQGNNLTNGTVLPGRNLWCRHPAPSSSRPILSAPFGLLLSAFDPNFSLIVSIRPSANRGGKINRWVYRVQS